MVTDIDPLEAERRRAAGALLLDVREADEWHAGHVPGATWMPMGEVAARAAELPEDREIVVVCRSGGRSARVCEVLVRAGYDAVNLGGGARAWVASGLPLVTGGGSPGAVD